MVLWRGRNASDRCLAVDAPLGFIPIHTPFSPNLLLAIDPQLADQPERMF